MYRHTAGFSDSERYGLASQIRRAAVSAPANIVEGAERTTQKDFLRHLDIAAGSASEVRYPLSVSRRLAFGDERAAEQFEVRYDSVVRALQALRGLWTLDRRPWTAGPSTVY